MTAVARYPDSTKASLEQRLRARARDRWPQIAGLHIRHRGNFSYVDAALADSTTLKLCRLRYVGSASQWQFAIYRASHDDYDESVFPTGLPVGTCQDALDTACGLYLNDPTAWIQPPTNLRARPLSLKVQVCGQLSSIARATRSRVSGRSRTRTPTASATALPIAPATGPCATSPAPTSATSTATGCRACAARAPRWSRSRCRPRPAGPSTGQPACGTAGRSCSTAAAPGWAATPPPGGCARTAGWTTT